MLRAKSMADLLEDEEFRNTIFRRFAALKLPLREGNNENYYVVIKHGILHK